jgi:hypothetical protein
MSTFADVGIMSIRARGMIGTPRSTTGSGFGPTHAFVPATVTPTLVTLGKAYSGPEDEAVSGPNFRTFYPMQYTVTATIAPGQSLTGLSLRDTLPGNLQFNSLVSSSPAGATCALPGTTPGGTIDCAFAGAVSGSASLTFDFYIPRDDAGGVRVLNALTGDDVTSCDQPRLSPPDAADR